VINSYSYRIVPFDVAVKMSNDRGYGTNASALKAFAFLHGGGW